MASHIIFRAKILLDEIERNPMSKTVVYNTMLMMDALEVSNLKGYIQNDTHLEFKNINSETISLESALKKEKVISLIKELHNNHPKKGITWLRREASKVLTAEGLKGFSYRQIMRDTKGLKLD